MEGLLTIKYNDVYEMNGVMARFSCFLEDPVWKGKVLGWDKFERLDVMGKRYVGHNMSVEDMGRVYHALPDLSREEKMIYKRAQKYRYLIAYVNDEDLAHEMQHAKYYLNLDYRKRVERVWLRMDGGLRGGIERFLSGLGYNETVYMDEFQAYLMTEPASFFRMKKHNRELTQIKHLMEV